MIPQIRPRTIATQWSFQLTGDFNNDGMADILWQDTLGNVALWLMNGITISNGGNAFVVNIPGQWSIQLITAGLTRRLNNQAH
jgi:hypothetical protein